MADSVFNIAKGAFAEKVRDDPDLVEVLLLKAAQADATLIDYDEIQALLANAGNTEADFTNYARKTAIETTLTVDDTNDRVDLDIADQTWEDAGGASNNELVKLVSAQREDAGDANLVPLSQHDFPVTTAGNNVTALINAAGLIRASGA
jgi:hypothetical protein